MSTTGKLMLACRDCGKESAVRIRGEEFDPQFTCDFCGASYEIEKLPTVDEINRDIVEFGKQVFAEMVKGLKRR
jgi:transcription elongation factor Elf1